jgi:hypothetical protein
MFQIGVASMNDTVKVSINMWNRGAIPYEAAPKKYKASLSTLISFQVLSTNLVEFQTNDRLSEDP